MQTTTSATTTRCQDCGLRAGGTVYAAQAFTTVAGRTVCVVPAGCRGRREDTSWCQEHGEYMQAGECASCATTPALLCRRAQELKDCPMGHEYTLDMPVHRSWETHLDALRWAELHPVAR